MRCGVQLNLHWIHLTADESSVCPFWWPTNAISHILKSWEKSVSLQGLDDKFRFQANRIEDMGEQQLERSEFYRLPWNCSSSFAAKGGGSIIIIIIIEKNWIDRMGLDHSMTQRYPKFLWPLLRVDDDDEDEDDEDDDLLQKKSGLCILVTYKWNNSNKT